LILSKGAENQRRYRANNPDKVKVQSEKAARKMARRKYWISKYKVSVGCSSCGYKEHASALDFDHLDDGEKEFHIAQTMGRKNLKVLFTEIRKCRVLCANCHRVHSYEQAQKRRKYW